MEQISILGTVVEVGGVGPTFQLPLNVGTVAPPGQVPISLTGTTIAAGATLSSAIFPTYGMKALSAGGTLTTAGTLVLRRFIDTGGVLAQTDITQAMTAATPAIANSDGLPFAAAQVKIVNSGSVTATLSGFKGLLGSS